MAKILWLVLLCAPLVGALFVLWTTVIKARTSPPASSITTQTGVASPAVETDVRKLEKADRLPLSETEPSTTKPALGFVPLEQPPVVSPPLTISSGGPSPPRRIVIRSARKAASEVTSWHWHTGSKAIKRR
jgi:hypothetical protein